MIPVANTVWNIGLAIIPIFFAWLVSLTHRKAKASPTPMRWLCLAFLVGMWLIWLPNTCYLMTEWRHLLEIVDQQDLAVRASYQPQLYLRIGMLATFYLLYSAFGVFALVLSIRPLEAILRGYGVRAWLWAIPLFLAQSVGVYLGLVLRFNSWDLWYRPRFVVTSTLDIVERPALLATVLFYALLLWALYEAIDLWIEAFRGRWNGLMSRRGTP